MRFWDTSALVCVIIDDPRTEFARGLLERDEEAVVWWSTYVECCSAVARRRREQRLAPQAEQRGLAWLDGLRSSWYELAPTEDVRKQARRLLNVHTLRAADALQLAAAIVWMGYGGEGDFVTFDARLAEAARREGFDVVTR
ncbi:MAG: type II toxin-antitoxin system VapC family toxin [Gemmatimonadota bacterium]